MATTKKRGRASNPRAVSPSGRRRRGAGRVDERKLRRIPDTKVRDESERPQPETRARRPGAPRALKPPP